MSERFGIYIHIPFCKSKCPYCDFYSAKGSEIKFDEYVVNLAEKIEYWSKKANKCVSSIYFGGGTPSVFGAKRLSEALLKIKDKFRVYDNAEITVEINPESGKTIDFNALKTAGFNRISAGLQSADKKELEALGRIHGTDDVIQTVRRARQAGIDNISLDLMTGIPCQTVDSLRKSIDFCVRLGVKHISSYILKVEENTPFYKKRDKLSLPNEDEQAELYLFAVDYLEGLGYKQYEISNFAVPGFESKHNTSYWKLDEYIGIGPSAHSFFDGKRFYYPRSINDFTNNKIIYDGDGGDEEEFIMLSLRLKSGLNFEEYEKRYNKPFPESLADKIKKYSEPGFMELNGNRAGFTPKGFLVSNTILSELI